VVAPVLVASTVGVFATGVALLFESPQRRSATVGLHQASFAVLLVALAVHVLYHLPHLPRLLRGDWGRAATREISTASTTPPPHVPGRRSRLNLVVISLLAGLVLALLTLPADRAWSHYFATHHFHDNGQHG
jgi:hypothetical protein